MRSPGLFSSIFLFAACGTTPRAVPDGGFDLSVNYPFDFAGAVCSPNDPPVCDGPAIKTCRIDGSGYDFTACQFGCVDGMCGCNPGDLSCDGANVLKCGMDGRYAVFMTCVGGAMCMNGTCDDKRCDDEINATNPHALPTVGWPRFRHDNRNTGYTLATVAQNPKLKWKVFVGGTSLNGAPGMASGPVVNQDSVVFIGAGEADGAGGSYYSFDDTGKKLWTFPAQRGYGLSTPAVRADGTSYFSTTNLQLYAVDPNGMKAWQFAVMAQADSDPIVTKDGVLIYSSDDGSLYAMDPVMGKPIWKSSPNTGPGEVDGGLAESCDGKIYAGGQNGWFQIDAKTGNTLWSVPATGNLHALLSSPLVTADGTMYGIDHGGQGVAVDVNGKILWQKQLGPPGTGSSLAKVGNTLYTVLGDGSLHALDAGNGAELWKQPVGNQVTTYLNAGPVVDGNHRIYFNSTDGFVYAFDANGNQLWRIPHSGQAHAQVWWGTMAIGKDGTLYVPSNDGNLYAYQ